MIERFQCLPRKLTRRGFAMLTGAAIGGYFVKPRKAYAAGSPFTIALVPDPQYLAGAYPPGGGDSQCSAAGLAYNALVQWAIDNRTLSVNGTPLNIKGFQLVGDCCNAVSATVFDIQQQHCVNAWALAEAASPRMFVSRCIGNHDCYDPGTLKTDRNQVAYMWRADKSGAWSPANVASIYGGGMDLGNGDVAYFGGVYPDPTFPVSTANNYTRLSIQGMKIGILNLEYYPRSGILNWAKSIHDAFPDHQWWVATHGYQDTFGARVSRGSTYGPDQDNLAAAPASNSGQEMWSGSDGSWAGLTVWANLTGVFCGHWIDGYTTGWVWQRLASVSASARGQTVQQVFCNAQDGDNVTYCSGGVLNNTSDTMHLMLLRINPVTMMMESFMVSTNSSKWTGTSGVRNNATPIQLFNVSMQGPHGSLFPLPSTIR